MKKIFIYPSICCAIISSCSPEKNNFVENFEQEKEDIFTQMQNKGVRFVRTEIEDIEDFVNEKLYNVEDHIIEVVILNLLLLKDEVSLRQIEITIDSVFSKFYREIDLHLDSWV